MDDNTPEELLEKVIAALREAGYNPYDQLEGYLRTGNASYITRTGGARNIISKVSQECIKNYLNKVKNF